MCVCVAYLWNSGKTESINKEIETETATAAAAATAQGKKRSDNSAQIISVISLVIGTCADLKCNRSTLAQWAQSVNAQQGCYACARLQLSSRVAIQSLKQSCHACVRTVCHVISVALSILVYNHWGGWRSVDW